MIECFQFVEKLYLVVEMQKNANTKTKQKQCNNHDNLWERYEEYERERERNKIMMIMMMMMMRNAIQKNNTIIKLILKRLNSLTW